MVLCRCRNRGIFQNSAKIFRLRHDETPRKGNRSTVLYELGDQSFTARAQSLRTDISKLNTKRDSLSVSLSDAPPNGTVITNNSSVSSKGTSNVGSADILSSLSPHSGPKGVAVESIAEDISVNAIEPTPSIDDDVGDDEKSEKKKCGSFEKQMIKPVAGKQSNLSINITASEPGGNSNVAKPVLMNNISVSMSGAMPSGGASPRSVSSGKRLRLVGTGTLNVEAHPYDHELVSMQLTTFNEVIHWNLEPFRMKPKKKDDFSLYLKATNALTHHREILLVCLVVDDFGVKSQSLSFCL